MAITLSDQAKRAHDRRYETALRWASRQKREDLVRAVASLFARQEADFLLARSSSLARRLRKVMLHNRNVGYAFKGKQTGHAGARAKLARDPKQAAKVTAKAMFEDWKAGQVIYSSTAAFARAVCTSTELTSTKTVERLAREWRQADSKK